MRAPFDSGISLNSLFPQASIHGAPSDDGDIRVHALSCDSRRVRPGDLFVALAGRRQDGHDHVLQAVGRGAAAVLSERLLPLNVPQCVVPDSRSAHSRLCLELAGRPDRQLRVAGVAGSCGKTVTSLLLASVLRAGGRRVGLTSSIGYCDSEDIGPARQTTPTAAELAVWLGRMAENGCHDAVIELDSRALADRRTEALPLQAALLTNLTGARHELLGHNTLDGLRRVNRRLFDQLADGGVAVVNADDPLSVQLAGELDCACLTVGIRQPADIMATVVERTRADQTFLLHAGADGAPVRTRMLGDFHVENCLTAAAAALALGLPLDQIVRGLEDLDRVPGRLDRVVAGQDCGVFLDASRDPRTVARNLGALRGVTGGRLICVMGAEGADDGACSALRGRAIERGADAAVVTSQRRDRRCSLQTFHDVIDGYRRPSAAHLVPCREDAVRWALREARGADTVLVAGAAAEEREMVESMLREQDEPLIFPIENYRNS